MISGEAQVLWAGQGPGSFVHLVNTSLLTKWLCSARG